MKLVRAMIRREGRTFLLQGTPARSFGEGAAAQAFPDPGGGLVSGGEWLIPDLLWPDTALVGVETTFGRSASASRLLKEVSSA